MRAMDLTEVISVDPDTSVQALAALTFRVAAENIRDLRRVEEHIVASPTSRMAVGGGGGQT
jgi:hypothetical protein